VKRTLSLLLISLLPFGGALADGTTAVPAVPAKPRTVVIKYEPEKEKIYKLIPLGVLDYDTVNKTCRPWLSHGGLLVDEEARNSVLVYDSPGVVSRISDFMRDSDRTAANIKVSFATQEQVVTPVTSLSQSKPPLVAPLFQNPQEGPKSNQAAAQFVVTRSGLPAIIWVAEMTLDQAGIEQARRMASVRPPTPVTGKTVTAEKSILQKVSTSLQVRPVYRSDGRIELELYPEIRYLDGPNKGRHVKLLRLIAKMTVAENQPVRIGQFFDQKKKFYLDLFTSAFFKRKDIFKIGNMDVSAQRLPQNSRFFAPTPKGPATAMPAVPAAAPAKSGVDTE